MKHTRNARSGGRAVTRGGADVTYTLDVLCELVGVSSKTILHYQEHGLIVPAGNSGRAARRFDDEALRTIRRIEHLRTRYEMNLSSLKFTLRLLHELEQLRDDLRSRR